MSNSAFYSGATRYGGSSAIAKRREAARKSFFAVKDVPSSSRSTNGPSLVHSYTINANDIVRREQNEPQLSASAKRILNWIENNSFCPQQETVLAKRRKTVRRFNPMSYIPSTRPKVEPLKLKEPNCKDLPASVPQLVPCDRKSFAAPINLKPLATQEKPKVPPTLSLPVTQPLPSLHEPAKAPVQHNSVFPAPVQQNSVFSAPMQQNSVFSGTVQQNSVFSAPVSSPTLARPLTSSNSPKDSPVPNKRPATTVTLAQAPKTTNTTTITNISKTFEATPPPTTIAKAPSLIPIATTSSATVATTTAPVAKKQAPIISVSPSKPITSPPSEPAKLPSKANFMFPTLAPSSTLAPTSVLPPTTVTSTPTIAHAPELAPTFTSTPAIKANSLPTKVPTLSTALAQAPTSTTAIPATASRFKVPKYIGPTNSVQLVACGRRYFSAPRNMKTAPEQEKQASIFSLPAPKPLTPLSETTKIPSQANFMFPTLAPISTLVPAPNSSITSTTTKAPAPTLTSAPTLVVNSLPVPTLGITSAPAPTPAITISTTASAITPPTTSTMTATTAVTTTTPTAVTTTSTTSTTTATTTTPAPTTTITTAPLTTAPISTTATITLTTPAPSSTATCTQASNLINDHPKAVDVEMDIEMDIPSSSPATTLASVPASAPTPFTAPPITAPQSAFMPPPCSFPAPTFTIPIPAPQVPTLNSISLPTGANPFQPTSSTVRGRKILRPARRLHR